MKAKLIIDVDIDEESLEPYLDKSYKRSTMKEIKEALKSYIGNDSTDSIDDATVKIIKK